MGEWVSQWDAFYRLCDRYDQELLCGKQDMQLNDYERLTYLSFAFGYIEKSGQNMQQIVVFIRSILRKEKT